MPLTEATRNLTRAAVALAFAVTAILVVGGALAYTWQQDVNRLSAKVEQLQQGQTPASIQARQSRARMQFAVCAKSPSTVDAVKLADFRAACAGYDTLAHAYRTEGVPPPSR